MTTTSGEGRLARQRRLLVHARLRGAEEVALGLGQSVGGETLNQYLRSGPTSRFFSRLFNICSATVFLLGAIACLGVLLAGAASGWMVPLAGALAALLGYVGIYHLAGWRSMRRHRQSPRKRQ